MRRQGLLGRFFAMSLLALLAGCASFSGQQRPITSADLAKAFAGLAQDDIAAFKAAATDDERKAIRNAAMGKFMLAIDDKYQQFTGSISKDMRGTNVLLDTGAQVLSGVGSVVSSAAPELSAASGVLTGTRSSLNKELFLERTLPAILTTMDANRLTIRTRILTHMRQDASVYSLADGLAELREYERAGNLNRAITDLNSQAAQAFAMAAQRYDDAVPSCLPTSQLTPIRREIIKSVRGRFEPLKNKDFTALAQGEKSDIAKLVAFMKAHQLTPDSDPKSSAELETMLYRVSDFLTSTCKLDDTNAIKAELLGSPAP